MASMIDPGSSIPELIKFIKHSFRECEFDEVQSILMEREKSLKLEMENLVRDRDELKKQVDFLERSKGYTELEKCALEEKLGRSERRGEGLEKTIVQTKEKYEKLTREKHDLEEKLGRSQRRGEELEKTIVQTKEKYEKLTREKHDVEEKLGRSQRRGEELDKMIVQMKEKFEKLRDEMNERVVKLGKENEELRHEKLSANKTIEELKAKAIEADRVAQELKGENAEAVKTIAELRAEKMKSDQAAGFYENNLDPRILKMEKAVAKMLNVNVEDLANLANDVDDFAAAATEAEVEGNLENGPKEDRAVVVSPEVPAISGSHTSVMQSGGEVPTEKTVPSSPAAGNVVIVIDDSDSDDEASIPGTSSWQRNNRTDSRRKDSLMNSTKKRKMVIDDSDEASILGTSSGQRNKKDRTDSREDSLMNSTKRRKISTSAAPSRCSSLPSTLEERADDLLQKSRFVDCVDSTDSDDELVSDAYMHKSQSKGGSQKEGCWCLSHKELRTRHKRMQRSTKLYARATEISLEKNIPVENEAFLGLHYKDGKYTEGRSQAHGEEVMRLVAKLRQPLPGTTQEREVSPQDVGRILTRDLKGRMLGMVDGHDVTDDVLGRI